MSCYQLINTMTKFEKRPKHRLSVGTILNVGMNAEKPWGPRRSNEKEELSTAAVRQFWRAPGILVEFMELRVRTVGRPGRQPFVSL